MKITGIDIGEYRQFKNIKFDFTYPEGHSKVGQPLDKVCFIGQSGTGKTTLLNLIWDFFQVVNDGFQIASKNYSISLVTHYDAFKNLILSTDGNGNTIDFGKINFPSNSDDDNMIAVTSSIEFIKKYNLYDTIQSLNKACIFIKESISREADAFLFNQKDQPQTFSDFVKTDAQIEKEEAAREERIDESGSKKFVSLGDMQSLATWQYLLKEIYKYDELTVRQITKIVQSTPKDKVTAALQKWIADDPRIELAEECLNPILNRFFLEVDTGAKGNVPIALSTKQGVKINNSNLSTGTRQLLATAIPIYKFDTKDTVILFDEPERSLFPDIQQILIEYYTSLAPEAQFFFATHSPIIAAAFEPCERFTLYFDENGEVKFRNGVAPEGDDPNDVLRQDFGMSPLMLDEGVKQYQKYLDLATQIRNEPDTNRKMELIAERSVIGNKYNFPLVNETT